nr:PREDICTED: serine/threonine-protein kinase LMTK1-like isoform X4 [Paralichthys olivaceus]
MVFALHVIVMSSAFFNPSFAFSSHFDTDGAPLSELSWPSSLAVVAVSFSGLFTFVFLMLACLCCKKGDMGFKEFENTEGEEYQADLSVLASPSSQNGPEVYILPLTEVSLPVSKQPGRSIQLLKSSDLGRHSLLYLKEIGHGWFGKVLLGEVNAGLSTTQVVVKELKASASVQDQMQFLEEVQPYRTLQHPALLQCLAQCSEVTPYLLVMEFCPLGDLKSYLRSCQVADSETPDPLILQRMACDIASGLLHLHKYNFIHSDLALRNCLLTSEMSVKIGDYGLSHSRYKDDYYVTQDQIWVALRWIAPELIDEVHGNLLVVDQTKSSNIWSLGVTVWELFELGNQPYRHYSDRQVLTYAVKEQQLKLPKPHLQFPLAERWYEVMQFCWLQPELRPCSEEVHLLVTYLCAKGSSEAEEDFEQRWNALRPNLLGSTSHTATSTALILTPSPPPADVSGADQTQAVELASSASSSFPLLEHFTDSYHSDTGDDLLTVTETSHGLNFEYKWELARAEQPYCSSSTSGPLGQGNPYYQDIYYSSQGSTSGGCKTDSLTSGISLSYYEPEHPGVVPVLSAHSPSVSSEYYIRIEEPIECNINLDDSIVDYSPGLEASNSRLSSESRTGSSMAQPSAYWSTADNAKSAAYDSDSSPTVQLTIDPLLRQVPSASPVKMGGCLTKESAPAEEDLGLETEHSGEEPSSELSASIVSEPSSTVQEASANHEEGNRRADDYSPVQSLNSDTTITDCGDEAAKENENGDGSTEEEELPEFNHVKEETENRRAAMTINEEDFEDIDAEECDSQDSLCEESNGPVVLSTSSSLLELCGENVRAPLEEAEDEDDSDDSESDEELRTYNIQDEDSEESEEDFTTVPVVVSDCSRARHLRSLLKMPPLLTQSCEELERKKKAVSFYDGVTVFLFDQESPTGELADYTFSTETEESPELNASDHYPHPDPELEPQAGGSLCDSEETDGSSEKDGSYQWEDDLSFNPRPSSPDTIPEPQSSPTSTSNSPEAPKPAAVALNRFMVSRFSITHVSDSHIDSVTGGGEDNPKD